jgi:hypothetical protein
LPISNTRQKHNSYTHQKSVLSVGINPQTCWTCLVVETFAARLARPCPLDSFPRYRRRVSSAHFGWVCDPGVSSSESKPLERHPHVRQVRVLGCTAVQPSRHPKNILNPASIQHICVQVLHDGDCHKLSFLNGPSILGKRGILGVFVFIQRHPQNIDDPQKTISHRLHLRVTRMVKRIL